MFLFSFTEFWFLFINDEQHYVQTNYPSIKISNYLRTIMNFIYPGFLFALSALAIPVIIHLFNFRKFKKIHFTNVRFLREIKQDTQSRSRIKHLLILCSRLLAVTFLVLAFAQPFIPKGKASTMTGSRGISIYIDNSFSMDAMGKNGSLIETAKKKAREIAKAYKPSDKFQLLTNDFEARHQRLINREEFLQLVDEVQSSASVRKLDEVISRQEEALNHAEGIDIKNGKIVFEISDFQKTTDNPEFIKPDSTLSINLVPVVTSKTNNIYIDTCWLNTPFIQLNQNNELTLRIRNISSETVENIPVKLFINGVQKALSSLKLEANSSMETRLTFSVSEPGWQQAQLSISDYPVTFDDNYFFSFQVEEHLEVLAINGNSPGSYLQALFGNDSYFVFNNSPVNQVDYSSFHSYHLIILNNLDEISSGLGQELKKYTESGGTVFIFPAPNAAVNDYKDFLEPLGINYPVQLITADDKVAKIESGHSIFSDVFENKKSIPENLDLPVIKKYYQLSKNLRTKEESLMKLASGNTFLSLNEVKKGRVYLSCVPLAEEFSNFPKHALFVPVMLKAAFHGSSDSHPQLVIGKNEDIESDFFANSGENVLHLRNDEMKFDIIPEIKNIENKSFISIHDQVKKAGNYSLTNDQKIISYLSFNYDRSESDLSCFTSDELNQEVQKRTDLRLNTINPESVDLTHSVLQINEGVRLWKYCIVLALLFLAIEILLIRFTR